MDEHQQPRKLGGLFLVIAVLAIAAAIWGGVALAAGSGSGTSVDVNRLDRRIGRRVAVGT
jgi:hypothetical protein